MPSAGQTSTAAAEEVAGPGCVCMPGRVVSADRLLLWCAGLCGLVSATIVMLIVLFVAREAWPALGQVGLAGMFSGTAWYPAEGVQSGSYSLWPALAGTAAVTLLAVLLATPCGLAWAAVQHCGLPRPVAAVQLRLMELLAGIPSVVYGFWGLTVVVPLLAAWKPPGASLLAGGLVLALMILPTVALLADAALAGVASEWKQGAAALGLSRRATLLKVSFPAARAGLVSAVLLAVARALGETMAVLMVCGNVPRLPRSVFDPVRTLTAQIALEMGYAGELHRGALFAGGLVLLVVVTGLVLLTESLQRTRRAAQPA